MAFILDTCGHFSRSVVESTKKRAKKKLCQLVLGPFGGPFFDTFSHFLRFLWQLFLHEFRHGLQERCLMIFKRFGGAFGTLFGSLFRPKRENEKVCLDCTGVYGLHIQLSGKFTFPQLFPSFFLKPCAGGHFSRFVRFCALLRLPVWHLLAPVVVKNRSEKMVRKSAQKRARE